MINERQEQILQFIKESGRASVKRIAEKFFVSEMTVRRDLNFLKDSGYIERYNGGAVYLGNNALLPLMYRSELHKAEKERLAKYIKKYLKDAITVFIDSSSTCSYVVPLLAEYKGVKIVTNSVYSLLKAGEYHIPCVLAGGEYNEQDMCLVGSAVCEFLKNINIDIGFFSSSGIMGDLITDGDEPQTAVRKAALTSTEVKIFMFSRDKQNKKQLYTLCRTADADKIIILNEDNGS